MANYTLISAYQSKLEYWKSSDGSWTEIPGFAVGTNFPLCVSGTIDDLWIGMKGNGIPPYNKPFLRHWNGSIWTNHFLTAFSASGSPGVGGVIRISATEVYCIANDSSTGPDARFYKWNGSVWSDKGGLKSYGHDYKQSPLFDNGVRIFFSGEKPFSSDWDDYYRYETGSEIIYTDGDGGNSVNCFAVHGRQSFDHMYSYKANGKLRVKQYGGAWSQIAQDAYGPTFGQCLQSTDSYVWTCFYDVGISRVRLARRDAITGANLVSADTGSTGSAEFFILGDGDWQFVRAPTGFRRRQGLAGSWTTINRGYNPTAFTGYEEADPDPPTIENEDPVPGEVGVDPYKPVRADVVDHGGVGVDPDTVVIKINKLIVWINDAVALPGWSVQKIAITDGFRYIATAPGRFSYGSEVEITWDACDLNGNCL